MHVPSRQLLSLLYFVDRANTTRHPVRLPHILLEYVWHVESVAPGVPMKGNLVWSNGDTTASQLA